ncbi:MAG: hypothetical protein DRR42_26190 [Gammaproteobacteria bacterium]|nr:MAG: hypothetical protein DRR42_26190 [Gammaproteobacteria bacterium]
MTAEISVEINDDQDQTNQISWIRKPNTVHRPSVIRPMIQKKIRYIDAQIEQGRTNPFIEMWM